MLGIRQALEAGTAEETRLSQKYVGQTITGISMEDNELRLGFGDNALVFADRGQSCCESRYMTTDDRLEAYVGAKFVGAELKSGPDLEVGSEVHETHFLEVMTTKGAFTIVNHNEHNGYYGGIYVEASG